MTNFPSLPLPAALTEAARAIATWADGEPLIDAVYVFGSRLHGAVRAGSDLDIAVVVERPTDDTPFQRFDGNHDRWRDALCRVTALNVDLKLASEEDHPQTWGILKKGCARVYVRAAR